MAYVSTEDLKRMCRMIMNHAKIIADNYCFVNKLDVPESTTDVTQKVLLFLAQTTLETVDETKNKRNLSYFGVDDAITFMRASGFSDEQINSIAKAFWQKGVIKSAESY